MISYGPLSIEDLLPSPDEGPDALYARSVLLDEIELALDELPDEQPISHQRGAMSDPPSAFSDQPFTITLARVCRRIRPDTRDNPAMSPIGSPV